MQFNCYSYLVLLLCAVGEFWALPVPARRWFVLAASIAFYATWSPALVLAPVALYFGVFLMARKIASGSHAGAWYRGAIAFVLAFLVVFRYHKMFGAGLDWLGHSLRPAPGKTMFWAVVPVGISFYTFE